MPEQKAKKKKHKRKKMLASYNNRNDDDEPIKIEVETNSANTKARYDTNVTRNWLRLGFYRLCISWPRRR